MAKWLNETTSGKIETLKSLGAHEGAHWPLIVWLKINSSPNFSVLKQFILLYLAIIEP